MPGTGARRTRNASQLRPQAQGKKNQTPRSQDKPSGAGRGRSPVRRPVTSNRVRGLPAPRPRLQGARHGVPDIRKLRPSGPLCCRASRLPSPSGPAPLSNAPSRLCGCVPASAMGAFLANQIPPPPPPPNRCAQRRGLCGSRFPRPRSRRGLGQCEGRCLWKKMAAVRGLCLTAAALRAVTPW